MQGIELMEHPSPKEHQDLVSELDQRETVGSDCGSLAGERCLLVPWPSMGTSSLLLRLCRDVHPMWVLDC
jgi:hypothetical protein